MKYFGATLTVLALFAAGANAQAVDPDSVSKDIMKCLISAEQTAGCPNPVDFSCICGTGPEAGKFFSAASVCPAIAANLQSALDLKTRLCASGLTPLPSGGGPVDGTATAAQYPDAYKCVVDAANAVGCPDLTTAQQCVCSTKQGEFLYQVAPCFLGTSVKVSVGLGLAQDLCKYGVKNLPGAASSGPAPTTGGPAPTTGGPAPTTGGPAPTTGGPAPTTGGPAPTTGGPAPTTGAPPASSGGNTPTCKPKPKRRRLAGAL